MVEKLLGKVETAFLQGGEKHGIQKADPDGRMLRGCTKPHHHAMDNLGDTPTAIAGSQDESNTKK